MTSNILRVQEKGTQIGVTDCRQGFALTRNISWGFIICSIPPT